MLSQAGRGSASLPGGSGKALPQGLNKGRE